MWCTKFRISEGGYALFMLAVSASEPESRFLPMTDLSAGVKEQYFSITTAVLALCTDSLCPF